MAVDEAAWAQIERAYVESDESVVVIARRFGIASRRIYERMRAKGVPLRSQARRQEIGGLAAAALVAAADPTKAARDVLIRRLYRAIGKKLEQLEDRMDKSDGAPPDVSEQQTRELNAAVSAFEKVTEVHTDADKARAAVDRNIVLTSRADVERLRTELAQRLHRVWGRTRD